jgi:hypothetical protein
VLLEIGTATVSAVLSLDERLSQTGNSSLPELCHQSVHCRLTLYFLIRLPTAKCFMKSSKRFRYDVMFENELLRHRVIMLFRFETREACEKNCPVRKENHASEQSVETCDEHAAPSVCNTGCRLTKDSNNCPKCHCANQSKYSQPLKKFSIN